MTTITLTPPSSARYCLHEGPENAPSADLLSPIKEAPQKLICDVVTVLKGTNHNLSEKLLMRSDLDDVTLISKVAFSYTDKVECRNEALVYAQLAKLHSRHFAPIIYYGECDLLDTAAVIVSYEEIRGQTLRQFLRRCQSSELINLTVQLFSVLKDAHDRIGFTHYDLHTNNVMVRNDGTICFIDYGSSYVREGGLTGIHLSVGAIRRETWWLHDVFKVLCSMYTHTDLRFLIKAAGTKLTEEKDELKRTITSSVDIITNVMKYDLRDQIYIDFSHYIHEHSLEDPTYIKMVAKRLRRQIMKIRRDKTMRRLFNRQETDRKNNSFLSDLLSYFTVHTDQGIPIHDPYDLVVTLQNQDRYYAISPEEAKDGSFDDFIVHLLEVEATWINLDQPGST